MGIASTYLLDVTEDERERLLLQGAMFRDDATILLDRCGVPAGGRAVEVACGPLGVLDLLSERVGPRGHVVGIDADPRMLEMAARSVAERRLANVELVHGEATSTGLPRGSFDVAHTRLLLVNVPDPAAVVSEMAALVRPGGVVAVQDIDWVSRICEPPHPAWDRLVGALAELWRVNGMDVHVGRRLPGLLRAAGLVDVGVRATTVVFTSEDPSQHLVVSRAEHCRRELVARGLLTAAELDDSIGALRAHLADPGTNVLHGTWFQAWGRVPVRDR